MVFLFHCIFGCLEKMVEILRKRTLTFAEIFRSLKGAIIFSHENHWLGSLLLSSVMFSSTLFQYCYTSSAAWFTLEVFEHWKMWLN